jgi:hypothetical protein
MNKKIAIRDWSKNIRLRLFREACFVFNRFSVDEVGSAGLNGLSMQNFPSVIVVAI